jgi:hypothetical protein
MPEASVAQPVVVNVVAPQPVASEVAAPERVVQNPPPAMPEASVAQPVVVDASSQPVAPKITAPERVVPNPPPAMQEAVVVKPVVADVFASNTPIAIQIIVPQSIAMPSMVVQPSVAQAPVATIVQPMPSAPGGQPVVAEVAVPEVSTGVVFSAGNKPEVMTEQGAVVASPTGRSHRLQESLEAALAGSAVVKTAAELFPLQAGASSETQNVRGASARTLELVAVVEEICDAIVVSPNLLRGEGEMRLKLKAGVLDGAEIQLTTRGNTLTVVFQTTTPDAHQLLERNLGQLEQHLAGHLHRYRIAVSVKRGKKDELT